MRLTRELRSPLLPTLALLAATLFLAREPGDSSLPWLGLAALVLAGVLFATQHPPAGATALLPLAGLAAWCAVSIAWSIEPDRSWSYANRTFVYVAFAVVGALVGAELRTLFFGLAALLGAVVVWSLAAKAVPSLHQGYGELARLSAPVGYWNALALLGDIALPIGLCLATRRRVEGTLLVYAWIVAIGLTYSRGGILIGVAVVAVWMLLSRTWIESLSTLLAAGVPAAGVLGVAFALPGLTSDGQSHELRVRQGLVFGVVLILDGALAVALSRYKLPSTETARRACIALVAAVVLAGVGFGAAHAGTWWHDLTNPAAAEVGNGAGRLLDPGTNLRSAWWREAWHGFTADPLTGTGAGSFEFTNLRYRTSNVDQAIEPHDLPVQFLSETGVVGLLLFLGAIGWLVASARRRPGPQLALALALPAYFLHGLVDIPWDFASISAPVFLIAGALAVRPGSGLRPRGLAVAGAAVPLLAVALSLGAVWLGGHWSGQAVAALGADDQRAVTLAHRARRVNPLAVDPLLTASSAELDLAVAVRRRAAPGWHAEYVRRTNLAYGYLEQATRVQPDDANAWLQLGLLRWEPPAGIRRCARAAYDAFNRFNVLDGQSRDNVYFARALAIVNAGKAVC